MAGTADPVETRGAAGDAFGLTKGYTKSAAVEPTIPFKRNFGSRTFLALDFNLVLRRSRLTLGLALRMHSESAVCGSGRAATPIACGATVSIGRTLEGRSTA